MLNRPPPETVNLHLWPRCNQRCTYCFERFKTVKGSLPISSWLEILNHLRTSGVRRVNFAGGEPTLLSGLEDLLAHARTIGLEVSIVTNAHRLTDKMGPTGRVEAVQGFSGVGDRGRAALMEMRLAG